MLKQKALIVIEVYLDSSVPPSVQIDVNHEFQQKLLKSAFRISQGSYSPHDLAIFDDTRANLFKDLLPYWAGFKFAFKNTSEVPLTKQEKYLRERLEEFLNMKNPSPSDFKLPVLTPRSAASTPTGSIKQQQQQQQHGHPHTSKSHQETLNIVFSIATGIKYKDERNNINTAASNLLANAEQRRNSHLIAQSHK